jgi:hypothetical protein
LSIKYLPKDDGVTHINTYSRGRTELGRLLTNFAETPFTHTKYGPFNSVEGLWYWLKTGKVNNELRDLSGFPAKRQGSEMSSRNKENLVSTTSKEFKEDVLEGIRCKLKQNKYILKMMLETDLPFTHYFWKGDLNNPDVEELPSCNWLMDELERIRSVTKDWLENKEKKRARPSRQ